MHIKTFRRYVCASFWVGSTRLNLLQLLLSSRPKKEEKKAAGRERNTGTVCFRIATEEVLKNGREIPDKVVSGLNSPGNSCGGLCLV